MTATGGNAPATTAPSARVVRWARDGRFVQVDVDAEGLVTASSLGEGEDFHTLRQADVIGHPVQDVLDNLFAALGDSVWVADEHVTAERTDYVMGVDEGTARDLRYAVAICSVPVGADRRQIAFAVDDSHAFAAGAEPAWVTRPSRGQEAIETFERLQHDLATWAGHAPVSVAATDGVITHVSQTGPVEELGASSWPGTALTDLVSVLAGRFGALGPSEPTTHSALVTSWEGTFSSDDGVTTTVRSLTRVPADPRDHRIDLAIAHIVR